MSHLGSAVRRSSLALLVALAMIIGLSAFGAGTATAAGADDRRAPSTTVGQSDVGKIKSKVVGKTSEGDKVTGSFTPISAVEQDGVLAIKGFLQGVIKGDNGKTRFSGIKVIPVKSINGTSLTDGRVAQRAAACEILNLVLGPLDLNILGLEVHLDVVKLDITAVPGAGNLLGNLLCAVAGLLDGGPLAGLLGQLRTLLNQILAALNLGL